MEQIMNYVKPELLVVAIVLYFVGVGLKKAQAVAPTGAIPMGTRMGRAAMGRIHTVGTHFLVTAEPTEEIRPLCGCA